MNDIQEASLGRQRLRDSIWMALVEFAIVGFLFWVDVHHHISPPGYIAWV